MFTVMFVLYRRDGGDQQQSLTYWRDVHGPIAARIPGLRRYVQLHAVAAPDGEPPFLGSATLEFDDEQAFAAAATSPELAAAMQDLAHFADPTRLPTAFVQPQTIVG